VHAQASRGHGAGALALLLLVRHLTFLIFGEAIGKVTPSPPVLLSSLNADWNRLL
jgi:hypothetical protein